MVAFSQRLTALGNLVSLGSLAQLIGDAMRGIER